MFFLFWVPHEVSGGTSSSPTEVMWVPAAVGRLVLVFENLGIRVKNKFWNQIWALVKSKLRFLGEKWVFPESCTVTASSVSCSCVFFTRFRFELGFGVKMKVVDNFVSFPMALAWRENDFWFRSYD
ncbi:hypothetical protein MTR_8g467720 [Medicago truncatula]|uniref:Uncharacterized protein n=1 Tax=Medicago truncatula TaxID=3880 RepID=A0A072TSB0_MEDTR|nr:hypothetical protein MTR_8g467720 [Medicago truncatula]